MLIIFFSYGLRADEINSKKSSKISQTKIRAEKITVKRKNKIIEFNDNVIVEKDDVSLISDRMNVVYEETFVNDSKKTKIKRIDAYDHVKLFSEESTASAQTGYYDPNENIFVLQKNVIVNNGTSIANGDKFIYNLTDKKGYFTGKKDLDNKVNKTLDDRVTVVIGDDIKELKKQNKNNKINEQKNSQSQ